MRAVTYDEVWPAVQDIYVFNTENLGTLSRHGLIKGLKGFYSQRYKITPFPEL